MSPSDRAPLRPKGPSASRKEVASMISQFIRPATRLRPAPISVRRNRAFRPASVLGLDELESRAMLSVTLSVVTYGADPTGTNNSAAAIQKCINAVSADGGGTVSFPAGTYKLAFAGTGGSGSASTQMFTVPSNITFAGAGESTTTLLMAPNQGNYSFVFNCGTLQSSNVVFQDLTFDQNGLNAGGTAPSGGTDDYANARQVILFAYGTGNIVQQCHFTNIVATWTITFEGPSLSSTVQNCIFDNIGLNTNDFTQAYDYSCIYSEGSGVTITGNTFTGRLVNGTTVGSAGAVTAIEIHGGPQTVTNNTISNFAVGVNVCTSGAGYTCSNQFYQNNTFNNVSEGFALFTDTESSGGPLTNCSILDNNITLDVADWNSFWGIPSCGIYQNPDGVGPIDGLTFSGNTITFTNNTTVPPTPTQTVGFGLITGTSDVDTNLTITNNNITDSYAAGIYLDAVINGLTITGNVITDPGSGTAGLSSVNLSAIELSNNIQNSTVEPNTFIDDR